MDGKKNVNIWKTLQKVPAGTRFVPLIIGALITTVCQGMLHFDLWATLGNPMQDMFSSSGQMLLIGLMLFCTGTSLKLSDMKEALHRGLVLIVTRLVVAYGLSALYFVLFGYDGIFGVSFLAFVCAVSSANAALYMGIIQPFGDKADKASFGIMLICSMPLLPLLFLGFFGTSGFGMAQVIQIISLLIPFVLGMVLGNLDGDIRQVLYFIIVIGPSYFVERRLLKRPGYISFASASLAGVALSIPAMAAASNSALEPYVTSAVAILAFVLAVTNILAPFLVKWELKRHPAEQSR